MNKQEIEKGCGKVYPAMITERNIVRVGNATCDGVGEIPLCEICQAKLQQRIDDEKEFKEIVDNHLAEWTEKWITKKVTGRAIVELKQLLLKLEMEE